MHKKTKKKKKLTAAHNLDNLPIYNFSPPIWLNTTSYPAICLKTKDFYRPTGPDKETQKDRNKKDRIE
jgi:hypothetical protein